MSYQKLVRDGIPEIIRESGSEPITRILSDQEFKYELINKLKEETEEFQADNTVEELADLIEVIYALCGVMHITTEELEEVRANKAQQRGSFDDRIFLEGIT